MEYNDLINVIKWWGIFFLIGISFLPLTSKIFSSFIDRGYIFSKVLGMLLISYAIYVLSTLHILKFTTLNILIVWFLLISISWVFLRNEKFEFKNLLKIFAFEEFIFLIALLAWSFVKSHQPDIHDLEKFMDFGFINSILRSEYFPARDMWFTPLSINYYYFGHLYTAVITKLSAIPSFITFNLMLATIFAFTFTMSFSIGINLVQNFKKYSLKKSLLFGLFFSYIVSFSGNLQTIYSLFKGYNGESPVPFWDLALSVLTFPNSYWYPNATRYIFHTIHEFPSYSFVVADLHGHVLDIPVVLTIIALLLVSLVKRNVSYKVVILISFLLSIAYMTNAWDGLIYLGLSGLFIISINFINLKSVFIKRVGESIAQSLKPGLILILLFFVFSFVFNKDFLPFATGIGLNCSPQFLIDIGNLGPLIFEKDFCQHSPWWQLLILYGFFIYMFLTFVIFLRNKKALISDYFVLIISLFSIFLIVTPEFFYLKDIYTGHFRANTMFKLSYQAFIMLSFSSVYILIRIISNSRSIFSQRLGFIIFIIISSLLLFLISIYPYFAVPSGYGDLKTYKGLDGISYLKSSKPLDYNAINWINKNIKNQPVIVEAQGDSYTDYARISANTGLPTILGWTVHEWLWRGGYDIPASRFDDIKNIYETPDLNLAKKIINKYNISLVYIGGLEREKYKISEDKFSQLGNLIYTKGDARIYKIR